MQATTQPLPQIFGSSSHFVVPLFQDAYVWSKQVQGEFFWTIVREAAQAHVNGEKNSYLPRVCGMLVLEQINVPVGRIPQLLIVQGQSQLITLQVLLAATRDFYKERCTVRGWSPSESVDFLLRTLVENPFSSQGDEKFKVWPTHIDRVHFARVMTTGNSTGVLQSYGAPAQWREEDNASVTHLGKSTDERVQRVLDCWHGWDEDERGTQTRELSPAQRGELRRHLKKYEVVADVPIVQAYLYFWSALAIYLETDGQEVFTTRVHSLILSLQQDLVWICINLDMGEDIRTLQQALKTQNSSFSSGHQIKELLLREAQQAGHDVRRLYKTHWESFDKDTWWREEARQGSVTRPRIDLFLWNYLVLCTRRQVPISSLFTTYRDWCLSRNNALSPAGEMARLHGYAQIFRTFGSGAYSVRVRQFFDRLSVLNAPGMYSFLLELFKRNRYEGKRLDIIVQDVDSFLMRRLLVGLNSRDDSHFLFEVLENLERADNFSPQAVRILLKAGTDDSNRWPGDTEFAQALLSRPLFGNVKTEQLGLVLQALEEQVHTEKSRAYTPSSDVFVEHLMPQQWQTHWGRPDKADAPFVEARNVVVETLGNLTLVSAPLRPAIASAAWKDKRAELKKHSSILLNRSLPVTWNEERIRIRGEELLSYAKKIWPFPQS